MFSKSTIMREKYIISLIIAMEELFPIGRAKK
jgi:hypothetical protein